MGVSSGRGQESRLKNNKIGGRICWKEIALRNICCYLLSPCAEKNLRAKLEGVEKAASMAIRMGVKWLAQIFYELAMGRRARIGILPETGKNATYGSILLLIWKNPRRTQDNAALSSQNRASVFIFLRQAYERDWKGESSMSSRKYVCSCIISQQKECNASRKGVMQEENLEEYVVLGISGTVLW